MFTLLFMLLVGNYFNVIALKIVEMEDNVATIF